MNMALMHRGSAVRARRTNPARAYRCLLDEQPTYLVPQRLLATQITATEFIVNRDCWFRPPREAGDAVAIAPMRGAEVWVRDPQYGMVFPYSFGPAFQRALCGLRPGQPAPNDWPPRLRWVLEGAHLLIAPEAVEGTQSPRREALAAGAELLREGYVRLGGLIPPFHIGELRRYYRYLLRRGAFASGDNQNQRRLVYHNEPVSRFFHQLLTPVVSCIAGEAVKPSYTYAVCYRGGAELPIHTDREQCEYSITLAVDQTPEPRLESAWPLHLETSRGRVTVFQAIGDALLFRGRHLAHFRDRLADGCTSTSILFHYVPAHFEGSLD